MFVQYTRCIIEGMGGTGISDDVPSTLEELVAAGIRVGVISKSHRHLESFLSHFELERVISAALSSAEHGLMKPHPSIFHAALQRLNTTPAAAVKVGDHVGHDVEGALRAGLRAVLLNRGQRTHPREEELAAIGVPTIRSLKELPVSLSWIDSYVAIPQSHASAGTALVV